jgi:hypothetical protein
MYHQSEKYISALQLESSWNLNLEENFFGAKFSNGWNTDSCNRRNNAFSSKNLRDLSTDRFLLGLSNLNGTLNKGSGPLQKR